MNKRRPDTLADTERQRGMEAFELLWTRSIPYLEMTVRMYRHATGLEVVCIERPDVENVFVAGFRTENCDNTGVQHILEHVVLGGSRNYRVKSPCEEMGRGSLATYINAETYLNRTLFPYASLNAKEFLNGVGVYLDAVFNPLLLKESFMQEGWRYELSEDSHGEGGLATTGIVLNERRAQMNDISDIALSAAYSGLLPGHPLSFDSGGTPGVIETLDYESFLAYYRAHYGLAQARLLFYGDIPTKTKLDFVGEYLERNCTDRLEKSAENRAECVALPRVKKWRRPRVKELPIAVEADDVSEEHCSWTLNWHLGKLEGASEFLGMELLTILLLEDDSSPLRRALQESGLCEDLIDCSDFEAEYAECLFIVGVVNCAATSFEALKAICTSCLEECVEEGFEESQVKAAFNQLRLRCQEQPNGYCLMVSRQVMRNWLEGQDPLAMLDYRAALEELERAMRCNPRFIVELLKRKIVENAHRLEIRFIADAGLAERRQMAEERRLNAIWRRMTDDQKGELRRAQKAFDDYQAQADSREALSSFPRLKRSQLPREPFNPRAERIVTPSGMVVLRGDGFNGGINYAKLAFDAGMFSREELRLLPVFADLLDGLGVSGQSYGEFERGLALAGAELDVDVLMEVPEAKRKLPEAVLTVKLSGLDVGWDQALDCLERRLKETVFTEGGHIREILRQCASQAKMKLNSDDDAVEVALGRSAVGMSVRETRYDAWYGIGGMKMLGEVLRHLRSGDGYLEDIMKGMMAKLRGESPCIVSFSGASDGFERLMARMDGCGKVCRWRPLAWDAPMPPRVSGRLEGISNGKTEFCCARTFRACGYDDPLWAPLNVYSELLGEGFLQDEIRMAGGAYGGTCGYYPGSRLFQMVSYRDPNPKKTMEVFGRAAGRVEKWNEAQLTGAIVACIRGDVPLHASENCHVALVRELIGLSDEERRHRREQLLSVRLPQVKQAAEALRAAAVAGWNDCVIGERRRILALGGELVSLR